MPTLDPSLILAGAQPIAPANPLDQYAKALQVQNAQQQNQMGAMQMQGAQQAQQDDANFRALMQSNPKATPEQIIQASPIKGQAYLEHRATVQETAAKAAKTQAEADNANNDLVASVMFGLNKTGIDEHTVGATVAELLAHPQNQAAMRAGQQLQQVFQQGGPQAVQAFGNQITNSNPKIQQLILDKQRADAEKDTAQEKNDRLNAEKPKLQAEGLQAQIATATTQLRAARGAPSYEQIFNNLPDAVKPYFDAPDGTIQPLAKLQFDGLKGLTPEQRIQAQDRQAAQVETQKQHGIEAGQRQQQLRIEGGRLNLQQKEYQQKYGDGSGNAPGSQPLAGAMEQIAHQVSVGERKLPRGYPGQEAINNRAQFLNPNLGDQTYSTVQSYLSADGKESNKLGSITRVLGHIEQYQQASDNLGNSAATSAGLTLPGNTALKKKSQAIADELGRLVSQQALTKDQADRFESGLNSGVQTTRNQTVKAVKELLGSQFEVSFHNYTKATGLPLPVAKMFDTPTQRRLAKEYPELVGVPGKGDSSAPSGSTSATHVYNPATGKIEALK